MIFFFSRFPLGLVFFFFFFWNGVMCFWVKDHCLFTTAYQVYIASKWLNTPSVVLNLFIGVVFVRFPHLTFLFFSLSTPLFTKRSLSTQPTLIGEELCYTYLEAEYLHKLWKFFYIGNFCFLSQLSILEECIYINMYSWVFIL